MTWFVNEIAMLVVACQLSRDVNGAFRSSFIVGQIVGYQSFSRCQFCWVV